MKIKTRKGTSRLVRRVQKHEDKRRRIVEEQGRSEALAGERAWRDSLKNQ